MKKLIVYTLLFISPFIIAIITMEYLLRKIPNEVSLKYDVFKRNGRDSKIICLGNSHANQGINPYLFFMKAINIANGARSLNIDYTILEKYQDELDSVKYILISVSNHTLWYDQADSYYKMGLKYYDTSWQTNIERYTLRKLYFLDMPIKTNIATLKKRYWENEILKITNVINDKGGAISTPEVSEENLISEGLNNSIKNRYTDIDTVYLYKENVEYLNKIIDIARNKHAKIIFYTAPAHSSYIDYQASPILLNKIARTMEEFVDNKSIFYFNFLEDGRKYHFSDFSNNDHLSHLGAKKFTLKLDSIIRDIEYRERSIP